MPGRRLYSGGSSGCQASFGDRALDGFHQVTSHARTIRPLDDTVLGDTVARFSRCGTELYVNTSCPREDQLWAIGEALDHLRGLSALGAQEVRPLRWSRSAVILPY